MPQTNQQDPHCIVIEGRLSYPNIFQKKMRKNAQGVLTGRAVFSASLLIPKKLADGSDNPDLAKLRKAAHFTKQEKWQGKPVNMVGSCLRDGVEKEATEGYGPSIMFISASSDRPIGIVERDAITPISEESGKLYAGCWVRLGVRAWAQDNENGKRINWALQNVQYVKKGEPFGEKRVKAEEQFEALSEEEDGVDQPAGSGTSNDGI